MVINLCPQITDVYIHNICIPYIIIAPNLLQDLITCQDIALIAQQIFQKRIFLFCKFHALILDLDLIAARIKDKILDCQHLAFWLIPRRLVFPQRRTNPRMIFDGILGHFDTAVVLETKYGFWGLIILMSWQQIGYLMIIYIAGLQAVPEDMLEAARIDGANGWQTLWKITIPNVMPSITICTFLTLTNSFKLYDQNLALTAGRPFLQQGGEVIKTTEMLALNIVNSFYASARSRGVGQAKAVIFFVLVAVLSILQLRSTREKEVQQ